MIGRCVGIAGYLRLFTCSMWIIAGLFPLQK